MPKIFEIEKFTTADKNIVVYGPEDLRIAVDYDDVDHPRIERLVRRMVRTLNEYWGRG